MLNRMRLWAAKIMLDTCTTSEDNGGMKSKVVQTRLLPDQLAMIRKAARAEGQTVSFYMRECLITAASEYLKPSTKQERHEIIREQIGKLLRQMEYEAGMEMGAGRHPVPPTREGAISTHPAKNPRGGKKGEHGSF